MARVKSQTRGNKKGQAPIKCGSCGKEILPGEKYYSAQPGFRTPYKYRKIRCADHPFKQSDLTNSIMADVIAAIEDAESQLQATVYDSDTDAESFVDDVKGILDSVHSAAEEVKGQYEEAAENFGGAGPNAERAEQLESFMDELSSWDPSTDKPDPCERHAEDGEDAETEESWEAGFDPNCEECQTSGQDWADSVIQEAEEALSNRDF